MYAFARLTRLFESRFFLRLPLSGIFIERNGQVEWYGMEWPRQHNWCVCHDINRCDKEDRQPSSHIAHKLYSSSFRGDLVIYSCSLNCQLHAAHFFLG